MPGSKESPERGTEVAQSRLTQVFKFLKALNELRNPVPRDLSAYSQILWLDKWPTHPTIVIQRGDREDNEEETDVDAEMEPTIRVQRARLTACPNPPTLLDGWLNQTWQSVDAEAEVLESRNFVNKEKEKVTIQYYYPNFKPDIIDALSDIGYRGLIIAGTGLGHVNKPLYPALKRAVREQQRLFNATVVLIEDKASGTQLIQELITDGCHGVTRYQPTGDKTMRLHAQTAIIENGFVHIPETAPWLAEYLHEMTVFPKGKHDDQADSTAQFLDWFKKPFASQGIYEYYRQLAETAAQQSKPPPVKTAYAPGCMEWLAEQEKARSTAAPDPVPRTPPDVP